MDGALATLFYLFESGPFSAADDGARVAFLNAKPHAALREFSAPFLYQPFKPYALALQDQGFPVSSRLPEREGVYDCVLVLAPKNITEARTLIARGVQALKTGGALLCAADNDAGGKRLEKILTEFGLARTGVESRNKARAAWGYKEEPAAAALQDALAAGEKRMVAETGFVSLPGVFGWDKIDAGSALLARHIPDGLKGRGADFGCGYGFLARHVLKNSPALAELTCIDADFRALELCRENLKGFETPVRFFWEDLTAPQTGLRDLDFIVMNPPFHEGKTMDSDIGQDFIKNAAQALQPGGVLYMVANTRLPYEKTIGEYFSSFRESAHEKGFKVFCVRK